MARCALAVAVMLAGCSFAMVDGLPRHAPPPDDEDDLHCTTSYAWPVADTVLAAASAGVGLVMMTTSCDAQDGACRGVTRSVGVLSLIATLPYVLSAATGYQKVGACRRAWRDLGEAD